MYARADDLWRMGISGQEEAIRLTRDGALLWGMVDDPEWDIFAHYHPVRVSPDGYWAAFAQRDPRYGSARYLVIVDTTAQQPPIRLAAPGAAVVAWSPDSRYIAYGPHDLTTYDLLTGQQNTLVENYGGINNIVWSPDGRSIAFACCFEETAGTHVETGEIQRVEIATKEVETVGTARSSFAGGISQVCWTGEGEAVNEDEIEVTKGATCSYAPSQVTSALSPDGTMRVSLSLSSNDQTLPDTVIVKNVSTDEIIWQRNLGMPIIRVFWPPSGDYLLLDNSELGTPIWRIKADGTEDAEIVVDDGYLLDVLPAPP